MSGFYETLNVGTIVAETVTQCPTDNSGNVASTEYVTTQTRQSMGTVILSNVTGGTYSFNCLGNNAEVDYTAVSGVVTTINSISVPGESYKVGDLVTITSGNYDSYIRLELC